MKKPRFRYAVCLPDRVLVYKKRLTAEHVARKAGVPVRRVRPV